jgi:biopolymer transport protein ExbD
MRRRRRRYRPIPRFSEASVNLTPLIDVVMVLIVFFMLVARIGITTGAEAMTLPSTLTGVRIEDLGNTLTLNVHYENLPQPQVLALIGGEMRELLLSDGRGNQPLVSTLKALRERNRDFKVILRAPKEMPYQYLEPILQACAEAAVKNVNFATEVRMEEVRP